MQFQINEFDNVSSTNIEVKKAIEAGSPEGFVVISKTQDGGYGRQGRSWSSPYGGLYMSVLLKPNVALSQLSTLSLVVALAVRDALSIFVDPVRFGYLQQVMIKWPNDVLLDTKDLTCENTFHKGGVPSTLASTDTDNKLQKICGISLEQHQDGICIGIGVNAFKPAQHVYADGADGKNAPAYLEDIGSLGGQDIEQGKSQVAKAILRALDAYYQRWLIRGFSDFIDEFRLYDALLGKQIKIDNLDGSIMATGVASGIDDKGCLIVQDQKTKDLMHIGSGEAHISKI